MLIVFLRPADIANRIIFRSKPINEPELRGQPLPQPNVEEDENIIKFASKLLFGIIPIL